MKVSPGWTLLSSALASVALCWLAVAVAVNQPWLGLELTADMESGTVRVATSHPDGPGKHAIPPSSELAAIGSQGKPALKLAASDLIEEPDYFDTYEEMAAFFAKQQILRDMLGSPSVHVTYRQPDGVENTVALQPVKRPWSSLPPVFWFQLFVGSASFLIGCWVLVLRPGDPGTQMFATTGLMLLVATMSAAIYSTRELALNGTLFRVLSSINHAGAMLFGCALMALFLCYPKPLVRARHLLWIPAFFIPWLTADILRWAPDQDWGSRMPIMLEMLSAALFALLQWWRSRKEPAARAAMRWFGLSMVFGCGMFVSTMMGSMLLGWFPLIQQGYSFGFFLIMYIGLALGLRRYRLFDLDEWAFKVLLWVSGALMLIALDAALVLWLHLESAASLAVALLVCGFIYLPLRNWLWAKVVLRQQMKDEEVFQAVLQVAFAVTREERSKRWSSLLTQLFDPLSVETLKSHAVEQVRMSSEGLRMDLPAVAGSPPLAIGFPWRGKGLFGPRHQKLTTELVELMRYADSSRDAYDRGVAEERKRIARDLHDDVGSRLLSGLQQQTVEQARQSIRQAIHETRTILNGLTGDRLTLSSVLAELRFETSQRLEEAGLALDWPLLDEDDETEHAVLPYQYYKAYVSIHREAISNIIRHAHATTVTVTVRRQGQRLVTEIADNGRGFDTHHAITGNGLKNQRQRAEELGGTLQVSSAPGRTVLLLDTPLAVETSARAVQP